MKNIILILSSLITLSVFAQKGSTFPILSAANLNEVEVNIPEDLKGKYSIVGVAFSEDAQEDLYSWGQPIYTMFLDEDGLNSMVYDVNVQLVLLFTGINKAAYNKAEKMIKDGTTEEFRDKILLYKGEMGNLREDLSMDDRKTPYIFVLDKNSKIIYSTSGRYTRKKMDEIGDLVED